MAAETGVPSVYLEHQLSHGRATKKTQGNLIERLRLKNSQNRSWTDSIKFVRSSVAERRTQTQTDNSEMAGVQRCLDTIQKAMKVISQQTLKERLDLIGRQLGLSSQIQEQKVSLGTDAFQVDVMLGDGGSIASVKLAHQGDVVECPDLKDILKRGDFTEFIEHLQGLQNIYQVTSDEKLKSKAFLALQALEKDLNQLAQFQSSISGVANYIHKCPLGILLPRLAGKPMKLIYFVSPYDLLDKKSLTAHPLTVEAITENFLGQSVTVCIEPVPESAPPNKLQTMPLMNVSKTQDGKSLPSFSGVTKINSMMLPASFVLVLPQSIPVSTQLLQKITALTNLETHKEANAKSLRSLILEAFSGGKIKDCRKLFVSLPEQQHIYFLDGFNGESQDLQGVMVSRIPFTHPTHVPQILNLMRQQLLFNIVIASCIRPGARKDSVSSIVFEVTAVSVQQLTIVFEHPAYDTMITVDIDLSDITNLKCHVACTNSDQILCSDEAISRVFQRCMSIPIMLRWLIGKGRGQLGKLKEAALAAEREKIEKAFLLKEMQQRQARLHSTILPTKERPPPQPPHPPPLHPPPSYHHHSSMHHPQGSVSSNGQTPTVHPMLAEARGIMVGLEDFHNMTENNSKHASDGILMSPDTEKVHNPLLSTLLDEDKMSGGGVQTEVHDSPMLSRLLDDNTSVATTVIPMNCKPSPTPPIKRPRKRRSQSDFCGPNPKHRISDNDSTDRLGSLGSSMDLDLGPSLMDQGLPSTPTVMASMTSSHGSLGHHHHHSMLNHAANASRSHSNVIDLTEDSLVGGSILKNLAESVDKLTHKDTKYEPDIGETDPQSRIPNIVQNSPSGSKNENASTSLEGFLIGSGEVGRAKDFDPSDAASAHSSTTFSKLSSLLLASTDSPSPVLSASPDKANSSFFSDKLASDKNYGVGMGKMVSSNTSLQDIKPSPALLRKGALPQSSSVDLPNDKQNIGIFEKFDLSRQQSNVKMEVTNSEVKTQPSEGKVSLKLKVGPLKQQNIVKPMMKSFNSLDEKDLVMGKSNSIETFDFKSDEDDDDPLMQFSDRYVYSASPTRLQISTTKQKRVSDSAVPQKYDKVKKKEKGLGNTNKRKRDKDESKREKKRKKNEHIIQESVYRTVENDAKADIKLKIRVKKPGSDKSDMFSDGKVTSYEISKKTLPTAVDKLLSSKQESKEAMQIVTEVTKESSNHPKSVTAAKSTFHKSSQKTGSSKAVQGSGLSSKTDPKLVTKATIRLKPLTMPDSGSTVNISQSGPKTSSTASGGNNKSDRRISASTTPASEKRSAALSSLLERRGSSSNLDRRCATQSSTSSSSFASASSSSSATTATTPTTTSSNLSLSSILPNAPSVSKVASMPRIPKLSSSSNTSINRTSSLDPASGTSPTTAGTKSNNSYNTGPAGRPNSGTTAGPGGNRPPGNNSAAFNYNSSRQAAPSGGGNNRLNFSSSRPPGPAHRQANPIVNSGQGGSLRPSGLRIQSPSSGGASGGGHKAGVISANSHKTSGSFTNNSVAKGNTGSSNNNPNVPQKPYGSSGAKTNSSINSKVGNSFIGQKSSSVSSSAMGGQKHVSQNTHSSNNNRISSSSSSNMNRSPNSSGLTKSPSSGKSPNISGSGRSPSLSSAGKSPSLTTNKSPNISHVNRSPNINSSSSGRSPNINSSRSPSLTNSAVRSSSSLSSSASKSPISSSHKQTSNVIKSPSVNKVPSIVNISKSQSSLSSASSAQRSNSISGSIKMAQAKNTNKTTVVSSSTPASSNIQQLSSKTAVSHHANTSINNKLSSGITTSSSPSLPTMDSHTASPDLSAQKAVASLSQTTPISSHTISAASPPAASSAVKPPNSCDQIESTLGNNGSKPTPAVQENAALVPSEKISVSTSSAPPTPRSADSNKSKFSFPSSRGRKNSLSAIVDKLKINAVGSGFDQPSLLTTSTDSQASACSKELVSSENQKLEVSSLSSSKLDENKISPYSGNVEKSVLNSGNLEMKPNHLLDSSMKTASKVGSDKSVDSPVNELSAKATVRESENAKRSNVSVGNPKCDQNKKSEEKCQDTSKSVDSMQSQDFTTPGDSPISKEEPGMTSSGKSPNSGEDSKQLINKIKDKPSPIRIPTPQSSPLGQSSATASSRTSSPSALSFQPLHSPGSLKCMSPLVVQNISSVKSDDQVFKMPSTKPSGDHINVDAKTPDTCGQGSDTKGNKKTDMDSPVAVGDCSESKLVDKKKSGGFDKGSSNPPVSPVSDSSSPENGLIIDDEESPHINSKVPVEKVSGNNGGGTTAKAQTCVKMSVDDSNNSINDSVGDKVSSPHSFSDLTTVPSSPKTGRPPSAKSPALSKTLSVASTPKGSDSPCEIDDDLMDEALGFVS